jgi:hypothetical protein
MRSVRVALTFLMLALAAASVLTGCAAVERPPRVEIATTAEAPQPAAVPAPASPPAVEPQPTEAPPAHVVVSYFHRTIRCETCLMFEEVTERALRDGFAEELASGRIAWRVADFEEPGHESDVAKYGIVESSLIVSRYVGDEEKEWRKLDAIWSLAADERALLDYIQFEVAAHLGGTPHGE